MRLGLFGGTFDPVHFGHLLLAETCCEDAALDEVWFIPNARSPHKQEVDLTEANRRVQMLELAVSGNRRFQICRHEIEQGGISYTVDTLETIRTQCPKDDLFFLMGADSLVDFSTWRKPSRICELATPLVVCRPDSPTPDVAALDQWLDETQRKFVASCTITMPQIDISSTDIRDRVREGMSIRYRTPSAVEKYIESQRLYVAD